MIQPRPITFWRFILGVLLFFCLLAYLDFHSITQQFDIVLSASRTWLTLYGVLSLFSVFVLVLLALSYTGRSARLVDALEAFIARKDGHKFLGGLCLAVGLAGFALFTSIPYFVKVFGGQAYIRYLLFILFGLIGTVGIRLLWKKVPWMMAFLCMILFQSLIQLFLIFSTAVTDYPFAMGWSETSRYYFPSLFVSRLVYGQEVPWPVLHPTLHLLLAPPYLFDAPLWFHRLWQVALRFLLVGLVVPPLLGRLEISGRFLRWFAGLWMFLFLFMGPLYFHLAVPVILVLAGFSIKNERRTWAAVLLASIWCGWSRVNWYPVAGLIAAVLYLLEQPVNGKSLWRYLSRPLLWFIVGTLAAFISQRIYIYFSGVDPGSFYTSLSSDLLWYRLLPNATYFLGLVPAALLASLPMWLGMYLVLRSSRLEGWHPVRLLLTGAALLVLFLGGLLVSLKIGGGADIHNLDAYWVVLLIVFSYLVFARYRMESGEFSPSVPLPWILVLALFLMPAWSWTRFDIVYKTYDAKATGAVLQEIQEKVEDVKARGGSILFITQRHLISMHMLEGVTLVPEYEREDLMEMAMSNNTAYLDRFRKDMEDQRFDLILVDPLKFNLIFRGRSFAEENNVWVRRVMRSILCNYREEMTFPGDDISLYVPQEGGRVCPQLK